METDVIAYIYPSYDDPRALKAITSNSRHMPPRIRPVENENDRYRRGSTEPPEDQDSSALLYMPYLKFTFSDIPNSSRGGFIFGSDPRCDVVLPYKGISGYHFSLTFNSESRLVVQDVGSLIGTQVTYDGRAEGMRSNFQWIVGGHSLASQAENILITLPRDLSFKIVVPHHDKMSSAYIQQVERFRRKTAAHNAPAGNLGGSMPGSGTRQAVGAHTPSSEAIELPRRLGKGAFGVVTHLWNVSTGTERVIKEPTAASIRTGQVNIRAWRQEARIMGQVSHPNIVKLIQAVFNPHPKLYLEYIPLGSLDDQTNISYNETLVITQQCLSALSYMHGQSPPIAHRDIKPANILVKHRAQHHDIRVLLADFGIARDSTDLTTLCGTQRYIAPEVYFEMQRPSNETRMSYTGAVDIWSLGVVACELVYGLPDRDTAGTVWCQAVAHWLQAKCRKYPSGLGRLLVDNMVIIQPKSRSSAIDCYKLAMRNPKAIADSQPQRHGRGHMMASSMTRGTGGSQAGLFSRSSARPSHASVSMVG